MGEGACTSEGGGATGGATGGGAGAGASGVGLGDARGRFVEQKQLRFGGQNTGQVGNAAQTGGEFAHELVAEGTQLEQFDE